MKTSDLNIEAVKEFLHARATGTSVMVPLECHECHEASIEWVRAGGGFSYRDAMAKDLHARHLERLGYVYHLATDTLTVVKAGA